MLNPKKVRLMTRMTIYDKNNNVARKSAVRNFKTDYVTFGMLKTIFAVTVAFLILVGMYILYYSDDFIKNINSLDYLALGKTFFGYYCVLMVVYLVISLIVYSVKYDISKKVTQRYLNNLDKLEKMNQK